MPLKFEITARCGPARTGRLMLPHGEVETPVFMPVGTAASVKGVPQDVLEELGVDILLGNTYHLFLRPGHEQVRALGGLHRFMSWERCILTDSGGYQVFSLSDLRKINEEGVAFRSHLDGAAQFLSPEKSMEVQIALGADIMMAFDECTEFPASRARTRESMDLTLRWAKRGKEYFEAHKDEVPWRAQAVEAPSRRPQAAGQDAAGRGTQGARQNNCRDSVPEARNSELETQSLFGIVQGGTYSDLRRESAERTIEIGFPGYAIGGLSVGEPRERTREIMAETLPLLPADRPRYLMGVGYPDEIAYYAAMGVDMMDCVIPTRAARHGTLFTSVGRVNIKNRQYASDQGPLDPACGCKVCARYSRAYLRHLFVAGEPLAGVLNTVHNLAYYLDTMRAVRHAIRLGELSGFLSGVRSLSLSPPEPGEGET